jgi:hypothetical protein
MAAIHVARSGFIQGMRRAQLSTGIFCRAMHRAKIRLAASAGRRHGQQFAGERGNRAQQQREKRENRNRFFSQLGFHPADRE